MFLYVLLKSILFLVSVSRRGVDLAGVSPLCAWRWNILIGRITQPQKKKCDSNQNQINVCSSLSNHCKFNTFGGNITSASVHDILKLNWLKKKHESINRKETKDMILNYSDCRCHSAVNWRPRSVCFECVCVCVMLIIMFVSRARVCVSFFFSGTLSWCVFTQCARESRL